MKNWKPETIAVQAGYTPENGGARIVPITQSTTYKYDDVQSVADLFDLKASGFFYTRLANPTVDAFEKKIAAMEGGVAAVATSSGQTANALALMNIARTGDHVVAVSSLYGGTVSLFTNTLKKTGILFTMISPEATEEEIQAAIQPNTKAIFAETLANPALIVLDIEKFAKMAHANGDTTDTYESRNFTSVHAARDRGIIIEGCDTAGITVDSLVVSLVDLVGSNSAVVGTACQDSIVVTCTVAHNAAGRIICRDCVVVDTIYDVSPYAPGHDATGPFPGVDSTGVGTVYDAF